MGHVLQQIHPEAGRPEAADKVQESSDGYHAYRLPEINLARIVMSEKPKADLAALGFGYPTLSGGQRGDGGEDGHVPGPPREAGDGEKVLDPAKQAGGKGDKRDYSTGVSGVVAALAEGSWDAIVNHPAEILKTTVISMAIGGGAALLPSAIVLAIAGTGVIAAGYALYQNAPDWLRDAEVVTNAGLYSPREIATAHENLRGLGGATTDFLVSLTTGSIGFSGVNAARVTLFHAAEASWAGKVVSALDSFIPPMADLIAKHVSLSLSKAGYSN
jgi:hypothetical protein